MSGVCEKIDVSNPLGGGKLEAIKYFDELINPESLLLAWQRFFVGKKHQPAVREFWLDLEKNLDLLYHDLNSGQYHHRPYRHFIICDPKRRDIYVADIRDRVVHQLLSDYLNGIYEPIFYYHSYASREEKGLHKAIDYFLSHYNRLNRSGRVWAVKMDVRKFFSSVSHDTLIGLLGRRVADHRILLILAEIIGSFNVGGRGLPLGNLTSQILANVYMHELDFYIKHRLRIKYYLRYNDDLLFLSGSRDEALDRIKAIRRFALQKLGLAIPAEKTSIISPPQVIDVLGRQTAGGRDWLRPQTARRAKAKLGRKFSAADSNFWDSACSYSGLIPGIAGLEEFDLPV